MRPGRGFVALLLWGPACSNASCGGPPTAEHAHRSAGGSLSTALVFSNCVLHAGKFETVKEPFEGAPGGTFVVNACSYDAECIARKGADTPGDGFVDLSCNGDRCKCRLEPLTPPGPIQVVDFGASCASLGDARRLLLERCMKGMHLASAEPDGG